MFRLESCLHFATVIIYRCNSVVVDSILHSQDPPSGMKALLSQVLEVLPTESAELPA